MLGFICTSSDKGFKYRSINSCPVGNVSKLGATHPESSNKALAALLKLYRHGENSVTCP